MSKLNNPNTLVIVTGASQGIGRTICTQLAAQVGPNSKLVLVARSTAGLQQTASLVAAVNPGLTTQIVPIDLSRPEKEKFSQFLTGNFDKGILIHNAGSEGNGSLAKDMDDLEVWQNYMALNLYSVTMLTSQFLKAFPTASKIIINITSLGATVPFKGLGYYCTGKAAREMYFRTLAEENPELDILNYAPGPVETEMITRIITQVSDTSTKTQFESMRDTKVLLKSEDTVQKMIKVLNENNYKSGGRIDYYDP